MSNSDTSLSELLTFSQLKIHFGISRTSAYRWMNADTDSFPKPVQLGPNSVRFRKTEILEWIENRPPAPVHGSQEVAA